MPQSPAKDVLGRASGRGLKDPGGRIRIKAERYLLVMALWLVSGAVGAVVFAVLFVDATLGRVLVLAGWAVLALLSVVSLWDSLRDAFHVLEEFDDPDR